MASTPQPKHFRFTDSRIRWSNDERDDPTQRSPSSSAHTSASGAGGGQGSGSVSGAAKQYLTRGAPTTSSARTSPVVRKGEGEDGSGGGMDAAGRRHAGGRVVPLVNSSSGGSEGEDKAGPLRVLVPVSHKSRSTAASQGSIGSLPAVEPTPHHMHLHPTTVLATSSRASNVGAPRSFIGSNRTARRASVQLELLGNPYDIPSSSIPEVRAGVPRVCVLCVGVCARARVWVCVSACGAGCGCAGTRLRCAQHLTQRTAVGGAGRARRSRGGGTCGCGTNTWRRSGSCCCTARGDNARGGWRPLVCASSCSSCLRT